jgi:hypothetical protein
MWWATNTWVKHKNLHNKRIKNKQVEEFFIKKQKPKITKICEQKEKHGTYK